MSTTLNPREISTEEKRALLADRLRLTAEASATAPLSFAQERLWFLDQLEPNSSLYNIPTVARLSGKLVLAALERAFELTLARHESLRTRIVCAGEEPVQVIDRNARVGLRLIDLTGAARVDQESQQLVRDEINRPFDLAKDRLLRATLVRFDAEDHLLVVVMHHIVSDEWSLKIFFNDLKAFYEQAIGMSHHTPPELPIQYSDYAVWQRKAMTGEFCESQLKFWKAALEGLSNVTALATDHARPAVPKFRGATMIRALEGPLSERIKSLALREEATLFMVLLAAFKTLIYRYTGQGDVVVGSPIAGRNREETEGLVGFFVNTLALRSRIAGTETFVELLRGVRERTLSAFANQDLPLEKLVEELQPERSLSHLPFTRIMFAVQNGVLETLAIGECQARFLEVPSDTSKFDLTFAVQDTSRGLVARVEYDRDLFDTATLQRLLEHFEGLLKAIVANPNARLAELELLSALERKQLVVDWNQTSSRYPRERTIQEIFEAQAAARPEATAVLFGGESLTYRELNQRANQLAHYLKGRGVKAEVPVAICMDASCLMVVAMLGCLKAGGFYLPLDPKYPKERLAFMLHDAPGPVLLTQQRLVSALPRNGAEIVCLDADWERVSHEPRDNHATDLAGNNLAYVMYTSGSTGQPKGVAVPHRAVNRLVLNTDFIQLGPDDRVAQVSNISFDAATFEIWGALLNGGELVGISQEVALSPADFAHELKQKRITAMFLTAALFNQLANEMPGAFEGLRTLIAGGEALDPKWVREVLRDRPPQRLVNGYGPTENTTFSCCYEIKALAEEATNVPIGRPIANTQAYVLDRHLQPVPIGVPGELYFGGDGLARGYWRRPELTAERFVPDPFTESGYLYKTGDLGRFLVDGTIEFLGRLDQQVKIRGFRIELGEIEAVLGQHPGIREAVVTMNGNESAEKRLIAYFVPRGKRVPNTSGLIAFLKEKLPEYMVPTLFFALPALPLTSNGKVDRQALPRPEKARPELERKYAAPRDEVEVELAQIWENILDLRPIGIEDRFFDLGGHSLLATRVVRQIEKRFGKRLRLATIFQAQTIEALAAIIREEIKESSPTAGTSLVEIQSKGSKPPLFLVHGAGGGMFWGYVNLSRHLGREQPVYGFKSRGLDGVDEFETLEEMAAQYVKDLRVVQPRGPYHLGGYCFGGNVAFEMARQLRAGGDEVALLALMNCAPPNSAYTRIPWTPVWGFRFLKNLFYWANHFRRWTPAQRREFFDWKLSTLTRKLAQMAGLGGATVALSEAEQSVDLSSFSTEQQKLWDAHIRAQHRYRPQPFPGQVRLFRSPGHPVFCSFDPNYGWTEFAKGGVSVTVVPATHEKILEEPFVEFVGRELKRLLAGTEASQPPAVLPKREAAGSESQKPEDAWDFWKRQLSSAPELLELPTDFPRPATQTGRTGVQTLRIPQGFASGNLTDSHPLGALAVLLHRYARQEDLVIGLGNSAATGQANPLGVLRVNLGTDCPASEFLAKIDDDRKAALSRGPLPFWKLVDEIRPARDPSYHPIFQVLFRSGIGGPDTTKQTESITPDRNAGKPDLIFDFHSGPSGVELTVEFATDLFKPETIERMLGHWERLLQAFCEVPEEMVSRMPILGEAESELLASWNSTRREYPHDKTLIDLFVEQVEKKPAAVALVAGRDRLSYETLDTRARQIASALRTLGVDRKTLVGICLERSSEMVAAILGVLRVGAAYVPMDPVYPRERLSFMMEDAKLGALLTQKKLAGLLAKPAAPVLCVEDISGKEGQVRGPAEGREASARPTDLAYVIYTSGSTGKPKGVALEHRNAVAFVSWAQGVFSAEELDGVLASTSICFDLSIFEMFVPLCCGGKVILAENALALPTLPAAEEVVLVNTVPSAIRELVRLKAVPANVKVVNLAGEPLPTLLVDQIYGGTAVEKVYDLYGPTETTTYSTYTLRRAGEPATIGRPLANEQVYLLDPHGNLQPIGVPGELYIGGDGVAREYLNRPELTAERFVPHPFEAGARVYRTGDLARWRPDGNIEFLGRIDHQVKIRGFRIELGEIESALKRQAAVEDAVVIVREDTPGDRRLVAYVAAKPGAAPEADDLRGALKQRLPEYMLPSAFVLLAALPLTPNGKIDRKALPAPNPGQRSSGAELILPRNPVEEQVAATWREVLQLRQVSVLDNFFDLGGHSLLAIQVVSRIREQFKIDLPLSGLFDAPTIASLSEGLVSRRWNALPVEEKPLAKAPRNRPMPASFVQERLWFLDKLAPGEHGYNVPLALRILGKLEPEALRTAFQRVVQRHEPMRTTFDYQDGKLVQVIAAKGSSELSLTDLSVSEDPERTAQELVNDEARKPFDLAAGPLVRARLLRLNPETHALVVVMHHTISDGWSQSILLKDLRTEYEAVLKGPVEASLEATSLQYADFATWQRQTMTAERLEQEVAFWKEKLAGAPSTLELPLDHVPEGGGSRVAGRRGQLISTSYSPAPGFTPFMVLVAALGWTLRNWTEQKDIVLGTVTAGRNRREIENVIGCFMNFLPLRLKVDGDASIRDFLEETKRTVLEAQAHQDCPFEKIVEAINPERLQDQNPLYNVGVLLQNFPAVAFGDGEVRAEMMPVALEASLLDLRFEALERPEGLLLECEYRKDLFEAGTIDLLLGAIAGVFQQMFNPREEDLAQVKVSPALVAHARTARARTARQTIAVAATFTGEPLLEPLEFWIRKLAWPAKVEFAPFNQVFQQLLDPASALAGNRRGLNVALLRLEDWLPGGETTASSSDFDKPVADFISAAQDFAGRSGVPLLICFCPPSKTLSCQPELLDAAVRAERAILAKLEDLAGIYTVSGEELARFYPVQRALDENADALGRIPYTPEMFAALGTLIARKFHSLNRAPFKVIALDCDQTLWSGVCGEEGAKGIRLEPERRALQEFMRAQHDAGMLLCLCSKNNDTDVHEVFHQRLEMPLRREHLAAARLNWQTKSENLRSLAQELQVGLDSFIFLDDNPLECAEVAANCPEVTTLQLPDDVHQVPQFLQHCWAFDHLKITSADRSRAESYRQNQEREHLREHSLNLAQFIAGLDLQVRIRPMAPEDLGRVAQLTQRTNQFNCTTRRRNESELHQAAACSEILTVSVSDRFGDYGLVGVVIFDQGDEALEIDTFLLSCRVLGRGVEHRVLCHLGELARERKAARIDVHFVPSEKNQPAGDFLENVAPIFKQPLNGGYTYRIPAGFAAEIAFEPRNVPVEAPAKKATERGTLSSGSGSWRKPTPYGEIALTCATASDVMRAIEAAALRRTGSGAGYVAPATDLERQLCALWQKLLRVDRVGTRDNFFELGGHSLLAVRLFAEMESLTGKKLPLVTLFQSPTVEELAKQLSQGKKASRSLLVAIQSNGAKPPLFLVHGAGGDVLWGYANLAVHMPPDQPIYGLKSRGQAGLEEFTRLEEMAACYLQEIRAFQRKGPYIFGGYCFGGNVAYEMARQLRAQTGEAAVVLLIDTTPANAGYETARWWSPRYAVRFGRNLSCWLKDFRDLGPEVRRKFILRKLRILGRSLVRRAAKPGASQEVDVEAVIDPSHFRSEELKLWQAHLQALVEHAQQPYDGPVTLLRTRGQALFCSLEEDFCWRNLVSGGVKVRLVPGSHESIFVEPHVRELAGEVAKCLADAAEGEKAQSDRSQAGPSALTRVKS